MLSPPTPTPSPPGTRGGGGSPPPPNLTAQLAKVFRNDQRAGEDRDDDDNGDPFLRARVLDDFVRQPLLFDLGAGHAVLVEVGEDAVSLRFGGEHVTEVDDENDREHEI